jgi:hypothetical protein
VAASLVTANRMVQVTQIVAKCSCRSQCTHINLSEVVTLFVKHPEKGTHQGSNRKAVNPRTKKENPMMLVVKVCS